MKASDLAGKQCLPRGRKGGGSEGGRTEFLATRGVSGEVGRGAGAWSLTPAKQPRTSGSGFLYPIPGLQRAPLDALSLHPSPISPLCFPSPHSSPAAPCPSISPALPFLLSLSLTLSPCLFFCLPLPPSDRPSYCLPPLPFPSSGPAFEDCLEG